VLRSVRQDATRLNQLLGEMLTLARGDAGQEMLLRESLDLSDLVQDVLIAMSPLAETREVSLRRGSTRTAIVEGDQTRLTQLLINLVDNGIKYTPSGGTVTVGIGDDPRAVVLTVSDTGVGIEAKDVPHVFERFYRVDAAHSHTEGGAGLGLPICQWIVQAHGGEISVASQPGQGTTFTVRLPRAVAETQAANPTHVPTAGRA
jgi:two-component system OmpR family sensor kinase